LSENKTGQRSPSPKIGRTIVVVAATGKLARQLMWDLLTNLFKSLFGGKGTTQIGSANQSVSDSPGAIIGRDINVQLRAPEEELDFEQLRAQMPELFAEMKEDLAAHPHVREFVLKRTKGIVFCQDPINLAFEYSGDVHEALQSKVQILENHGLVRDVTATNIPRYRFSEALVKYLSTTGIRQR
jgi:hypothetical protein